MGVDVSAPNIELGMVALEPNMGLGLGVDASSPNVELGVVAPRRARTHLWD